MLPYKEEKVVRNVFIRTFNENVDNDELVWHRDHEDRIIEVLRSNNWKLQLENELPQPFNNGSKIYLKAELWHRIIKGRGNLVIKITKL